MNSYEGHSIAADTRDFLNRAGRMLIGGDWVDAISGETLSVADPATGEDFARVPAGNAGDVDRAVAAARAALEQGDWPRMRPVDRERQLLRLADLVEANAQQLAELEALDNGKPVTMARHVDVALSVDFLRYMAGWATKIDGSTNELSMPLVRDREFFGFTRREPVGVVGAIIPWNFPLLMVAWKVAPALATGCTVVLKPAEETPLTALRFAELVGEAGYPAGVLNVVTGYGHTAGAALSSHPGVDKIAFTGSTEIGKLVGKAAIDN
ncbi:MAG: aldehyde dehydrogenase family protein, partial [Rhodocyclaceae bacterium]